MRGFGLLLGGAAALIAVPGFAAEKLRFGPAPQWVQPASIPEVKPTAAPVATLLSDHQISFDRGKTVTYAETAIRIQSAQGLSAGNISFSWDPTTDSVTVNKLHIRRGDKVIDVLAAGQTFTVLRRESNLEAAMLDGTLTANIQPEGLQEGDIIDLATTVESSDPVWKGHVEGTFAEWNGLSIEYGRARVTWPAAIPLRTRQSPGLPAAHPVRTGDRQTLELSARGIQPLLAPKGAPARFAVGRLAEATDFRSWAELADLFRPLYRSASVIPRAGPLRDELNKIRNASPDPKVRAEQALALVQDRIRYVALGMGQGGYVPATAETTWSRRFGDCKAKTALLLALLGELGIDAEPVFVNTAVGDAVGDRLPMIQLFNHVLVRARIGGKDYWLDGTRTGDVRLDDIAVPDLGWSLPLIANSALVHVVPPPLAAPEVETRAEINATEGVYAAAPATVENLIRGDTAVGLQTALSALTEAQRQEFFRSYLRQEFDLITFQSASSAFDKAKRELRITTSGNAKLDWTGGYFHVPGSSVGFTPDFDRPAGPLHDAPVAVAHPQFARTVIKLRMPRSFLASRRLGSANVRETLAGMEYRRDASVDGDLLTIETSERSLVPEVTYAAARSAEGRLKALADEDVALPLPTSYRMTPKDLAAIRDAKPASKQQFIDRGLALLDSGNADEAIADFDSALAIDPKDPWALADRGIARVWKGDFAAAAKDLAAAEAIDPDNPVVARAKALRAELSGDHKAAVALYTKALEIEPRNGFALGHRALMYRATGDDEKALADSEQALKDNPGWIDLRMMRANILYASGKRALAAAEAAKLVADNPGVSYAQVGAGRVYARLGMRAEAMQAFERALAIKPEAYIYVNRAQSRPFADYSGRLADLDAALKLEPDNPTALGEKAEQLAVTGDLPRALDLYERIVKLEPNNSYFLLRRAILLVKSGRAAEAQKIIAARRAQAKTPSDFNSLCWNLATSGVLLDSALQDCKEAQRLAPESGPITDSLAFVKLRMGQFDEAIELYRKAIERYTGSASYMGRAIAYARKGDKTRAAADRAEALKLDPDAEMRFAEFGLTL